MTSVNLSTRNFKAEEFVGENLALAAKGPFKNVKTVHGVRNAYKADIAVLSGPEAGLFFEDVLVFNTVLVSQLERAAKTDDPTVIGELLWVTTVDGERSYPLIDEEDVSPKLIALASKFGI